MTELHGENFSNVFLCAISAFSVSRVIMKSQDKSNLPEFLALNLTLIVSAPIRQQQITQTFKARDDLRPIFAHALVNFGERFFVEKFVGIF